MVFVLTNKPSIEYTEDFDRIEFEDFNLCYNGDLEVIQEENKICIFEGNMINRRELKSRFPEELEKDAGLFLSLYEEKLKPLESIDGHFTALIIENREVKVFRDVFGSKPVYYSKDESSIFISSSITPIIQAKSGLPELCRPIAADYLANGLVDHSRKTFFQGIKRLKPCEKLSISKKDVDIEEISYSQIDTEKGLKSQIDENIKCLKPEDEEYYCPVSGGLDSTIVASRCSDAEHIFMSFKHGTGDEKYVPAVKSKYDLDIQKIEVRPIDLIDELKNTITSQEEPVAYPATQAQSLLYQEMEDDKKVISGTGSDELFYGYTWFLPFYLADKLKQGNPIEFFKKLANYRKSLGPTHLRGLKEILLNGSTTISTQSEDLIKAEARSIELKNLEEAREKHLKEFYTPHMLRAIDKNSDHHNVESRPVFLSRKLLELLERQDFEENFQEGLTKYSLRREFKEVLPEKVYNRKNKAGFVSSENALFTDTTRERFREIFKSESFQNRELIKGKKVLRLLESGQLNFEEAYRFCSYEIWMREFID